MGKINGCQKLRREWIGREVGMAIKVNHEDICDDSNNLYLCCIHVKILVVICTGVLQESIIEEN